MTDLILVILHFLSYKIFLGHVEHLADVFNPDHVELLSDKLSAGHIQIYKSPNTDFIVENFLA